MVIELKKHKQTEVSTLQLLFIVKTSNYKQSKKLNKQHNFFYILNKQITRVKKETSLDKLPRIAGKHHINTNLKALRP